MSGQTGSEEGIWKSLLISLQVREKRGLIRAPPAIRGKEAFKGVPFTWRRIRYIRKCSLPREGHALSGEGKSGIIRRQVKE
jgi:hypothetical protein